MLKSGKRDDLNIMRQLKNLFCLLTTKQVLMWSYTLKSSEQIFHSKIRLKDEKKLFLMN